MRLLLIAKENIAATPRTPPFKGVVTRTEKQFYLVGGYFGRGFLYKKEPQICGPKVWTVAMSARSLA
jgi:hypothetical protein